MLNEKADLKNRQHLGIFRVVNWHACSLSHACSQSKKITIALKNTLALYKKSNVFHNINFIIFLITLTVLTGCMEIENRFILQQDGSAVIKESIKIHKEFLAYSDDSGKPFIMTYLEKPACEERAKAFGKGVVMRSHAIKNINGGVKVLEAEYFIPDITDLCIINPYLSYTNYSKIGSGKIKLEPSFQNAPGAIAGMMYLSIVSEKPGESQKEVKSNEPLVKSPAPSVIQKYRNLQPIFKSLMKDFRLSVVFESYDSVDANYGLRDRGSKPRSCEILSFSGSDYDNMGGSILDNDEIMQEILRQKFWDYNFIKTAQNCSNNLFAPVVSDEGSPYGYYRRGGKTIFSFRPSKQLFQKYFEGKELNLGQHQKFKIIKAEFDQIGYDPSKDGRKLPPKASTEPANKDATDLPVPDPK